jgi:TolB protein
MDIWAMHADGSHQRQLTSNPFADSHPAWSPDGKQIAFQRVHDGNTDVFVITVATRSVRRITTDAAFDGDPTWNPNGRIAFVSTRSGNREIWSILPNGTGLALVLRHKGPDIDPAWAPAR